MVLDALFPLLREPRQYLHRGLDHAHRQRNTPTVGDGKADGGGHRDVQAVINDGLTPSVCWAGCWMGEWIVFHHKPPLIVLLVSVVSELRIVWR